MPVSFGLYELIFFDMVFNKALSLIVVSSVISLCSAAQAATINGFTVGGDYTFSKNKLVEKFDLTTIGKFNGTGIFKDAKTLGAPGSVVLKPFKGTNSYDIGLGDILNLDLAPKLDKKLDVAFDLDGFMSRLSTGGKSSYVGYGLSPSFVLKDAKETTGLTGYGTVKVVFAPVSTIKGKWSISYAEQRKPSKAVPEPTALLGLGAFGLFMANQRRKKQAQE
jgi:hypothetical protein